MDNKRHNPETRERDMFSFEKVASSRIPKKCDDDDYADGDGDGNDLKKSLLFIGSHRYTTTHSKLASRKRSRR